jgi:hypothetical protein
MWLNYYTVSLALSQIRLAKMEKDVRKIGIFWYILIPKLHIQFVNNFVTMLSEKMHMHMFKVNMKLMMNPIKERSIRLCPEMGLVLVVPDAPLPAGADMLEWPA